MISIISPAKTMDFTSEISLNIKCSQISNFEQTSLLLEELESMSIVDLQNILGISEKLAKLNFDRYKNFDNLPSKAAIYAYNGDVYSNMDRENFTENQIIYAQNHVNIISGFYGLLCPLDQIQAYRLEMQNKLPINAKKGLNNFWKDSVTNDLSAKLKDHSNKFIVNLASEEYSKAIDRSKIKAIIIDIYFLEKRDGVLKNIAINAKRARGRMLGYIIQNEIDSPKLLKSFNLNGYQFNNDKSTDRIYYFTK